MKTYTVSIPITVRGTSEVTALRRVRENLLGSSFDDFHVGEITVQQTGGPHEPVAMGLCPVCLHYGSDCTGDPA